MIQTAEDTSAAFKLADAIKELMEYCTLEKITVTDIVRRAGFSRQTFYRNFRDKYDLVNWYFDILARQCFNEMGITLTLREGLILKLNFIRREKIFFAQAFRSTDYNSIDQLADCAMKDACTPGNPCDPSKKDIVELFKSLL